MGAFLNLYRCNVPVGARFISPHASAWGGPRAYKSRPYWEIAPLLGNRAPTGTFDLTMVAVDACSMQKIEPHPSTIIR